MNSDFSPENHRAARQAILRLAQQRGAGETICPSEAARAVFGEKDSDWRAGMDLVRSAAFELHAERRVRLFQKGESKMPDEIVGPFRIGVADE